MLVRRDPRIRHLRASTSSYQQQRNFRDGANRVGPAVNRIATTAGLGSQRVSTAWARQTHSVFHVVREGTGGPMVRRRFAPWQSCRLGHAQRRPAAALATISTCKSSTTSHQSEFAFVDAIIPVLNPAGVQEIIDFGIYGWALSRYSGCWVALKCVKDTVEATASVEIDPARVAIRLPEVHELPAKGLGIRWPDSPTSRRNSAARAQACGRVRLLPRQHD